MRLFTVAVSALVASAGAAGPVRAQLPGLAGAAGALKATDDFRKGAEALERAAKSFEATAKVIEGAAKGFGADLVKASENVAQVGKDFDPFGVKMAITTLAEQNKQLAQLVDQQRQTTAILRANSRPRPQPQVLASRAGWHATSLAIVSRGCTSRPWSGGTILELTTS